MPDTCATERSSSATPRETFAVGSLRQGNRFFVEVVTDLLHRGLGVRFRATGHSMYPTICEGEVITVEPVSSSAVRWGDIILYRAGEGVIAHRVVRKRMSPSGGREFICRGDALGPCDEPAGVEQVLGKVVCVERGGRKIALDTARSKATRALRSWAGRFKRGILRRIRRR